MQANLVDKNQQNFLSQKKNKPMQSTSNNIISMKHNNQQSQDEIVLFKFKRTYHEESFDEIKIHSKKIKPNPESTEKALQQYKKKHFIDREAMLTQMFQKLQLKNKQPHQSTSKHTQSLKQQNKPSYFLKKINFQEQLQSHSHQHTTTNEQIKTQATRIRLQIRKQSLQQRLNRNRGITTNQTEKKNRVKYKIIDIRQQNFVELNGQKVQYQDLSKDYSQEQKQRNAMTTYDYYILSKRTNPTTTSHQPSIILPQEAQYLLQQQQNHKIDQQQLSENSSDDSNREDREDYDYPEEDYHQSDEDNQSEGIIGRNDMEDYDGEDNSEGDLRNDYQQQDEEEYYRQYLRRCRRKENGDDEITYLYSLKPAKYENDSDQY